MNNLLDTHTFIWFINGDKKLSAIEKTTIESDTAVNHLSIASLWEIAIKINVGKLELKTSFTDLSEKIRMNAIKILPVTFQDTLTVSSLPHYHRDPFDRMIVVQCINNDFTLISKDAFLKEYTVNLIW